MKVLRGLFAVLAVALGVAASGGFAVAQQSAPVFNFAVNLSTAKPLGITIPTYILAQATQVIE